MIVYIEVIEGTDKGLRFKAKEGLRIGRTVGEITLNDGKISSLHAQIEKDTSGKFIIKDLDSSNGLYVDARRVKKIMLLDNVTFSMGKTKFRVVLSLDNNFPLEKQIPENIKSINLPEKLEVPTVRTSIDQSNEVLAVEPDLSTWKNVFSHFLSDYNIRHLFQATLNPNLRAFKNPLILKFTAGMQTDTQWVLGWGPRSIGRDTIELRLLDSVCPELAFTISPDPNGIPIFNTSYHRIVLYNEKSISSCEVNSGDQIQIGDNILELNILDSTDVRLEIEDE